MKKLLTFLLLTSLTCVYAQDYPCKKQIEQGHYEKAKVKNRQAIGENTQ